MISVEKMTDIDKAIKIMNSLSGYERFTLTNHHYIIVDTKDKMCFFGTDFISLTLSVIYSIYQKVLDEKMTRIDKAVLIMNTVSGYERFKHNKGDKFIEDTKMDVGYFPDEFINLMITKLYTYVDYLKNQPIPIARQYSNEISRKSKY